MGGRAVPCLTLPWLHHYPQYPITMKKKSNNLALPKDTVKKNVREAHKTVTRKKFHV